MGRVHLAAYQHAAHHAAAPVCVYGLCDARGRDAADGRPGNLALDVSADWTADVRISAQYDALLDDPRIDLISICTPTDTHVPLAVRALETGKHVLVEKPVSLVADQIERLDTAARAAGRWCLPGMCMRYWPGWVWLLQAIVGGVYGPVRSAVFRRLGSMPDWSAGFYGDHARSGGALVDLHIHDADFVRWCFGDPAEVVSTGEINHVTTFYRFADGPPHVAAEGCWEPARGLPFVMYYRVGFERATVEYDSTREQPLLLGRDGRVEPVDLPPGSGYDAEIRHMLALIAGEEQTPRVTLADAAAVTRLLDAERESLHQRSPIALTQRL